MNPSMFKTWMLRADTLQGVAQNNEDSDFWAGYMRGLRKLHHGDAFGTPAEHELWVSILADEPDLTRRARGEGYRAGFSGTDPVEMFRLINGEYLTCPQLAEASGVVASRIRQIADKIPGGRRDNNKGWRFPLSAVGFVRSLPGRGRPPRKTGK